MAGLTFMFETSIGSVSYQEWGANSTTRRYLTTGEGYTKLNSSVKSKITEVSKRLNISDTPQAESLFLLSAGELSSWFITNRNMCGLGLNKDEIYLNKLKIEDEPGQPGGTWVASFNPPLMLRYDAMYTNGGVAGNPEGARPVYPAFCL